MSTMSNMKWAYIQDYPLALAAPSTQGELAGGAWNASMRLAREYYLRGDRRLEVITARTWARMRASDGVARRGDPVETIRLSRLAWVHGGARIRRFLRANPLD